MTRFASLLFIAAFSACAQSACPSVNFLSARTVNLKPTSTSHIDVVRQTNGSYTGFEVADVAPYRLLATFPHFEQQFAACLPHTLPVVPPTIAPANTLGLASQLQVAAMLPSGNYFVANISSDASTLHFDLLDSQHNLLSETNFAPGETFQSLALADVNHDGKLDLIAVFEVHAFNSFYNGGVEIFFGNGDGSFQPHNQQVFATRPMLLPVQSVAIADVNGDGKLDLVLAAPYGGSLYVALGNGDGTFSSQLLQSSPSEGFLNQVSIALADLNGDGKIDLVLLPGPNTPTSPTIGIALGNGDGTFRSPTAFAVAPPPSSGVSAAGVAIGDLNGDGVADIVTTSGTILFGDGKGAFPTRQDYSSTATGSVMIGDFDGDGIADIIFGNGNSSFLSGNSQDSSLTVLIGSGAGKFLGAPVTAIPGVTTALNPIATADFNGDGIPDLALATTTPNNLVQLTVITGTGGGQLSPGAPQTFPEPGTTGPVFQISADFNHDGKADLAVLLARGVVQIYPGVGNGTFANPTSFTIPDQDLRLLATPDINGDGIPDLVAWSLNNIFVFLGKGDGTFSPQTFTMSVSSPAVAFGDFNRDGKIDIAIANATQATVTVLLGKGDGTFPTLVTTALPAPAFGVPLNVILPTTTIAAADFDGDGLLDLAITVGTIVPQTFPAGNFQIVVLSGRGDGGFAAVHATAGLVTSQVAVDINKDGIPDLVGNLNADFVGGGLSVFLGNGDGTFQPAVLLQPAGSTFAVADFNRDGAPDLAALNSSGITTFLNLSQPPAPLSVVSAASFAPGPLAPNSIASAFGQDLASATASGTLNGSSHIPAVNITDSGGTTRPASLFFVSPSQINFLVPTGTAAGPAIVGISGTPSGKPLTAQIQIAALAPAIFTNGANMAASYAVQVSPGGAETTISSPIDLSQPGQVYLILFGTGFDSATAATTVVTVQGVSATVTYSGPQPVFPGLDQINLVLPASLAGTGVASVVVSAGGQISNITVVTIQ